MLKNKYYIVKAIIVLILLIAVSSQVFSQQKPVKVPVKVNSASSKNTTSSTKPAAKKPQVKIDSAETIVSDSAKTVKAVKAVQKKSIADSVKKTVKKLPVDSLKSKSSAAKKPGAKTATVKKSPKDSLIKSLAAVKSDSVNAIPVGFAIEKTNAPEQKITAKKRTPVKGSGKIDPKAKGAKNAKTPPVKKPIMNIIDANSVGSLNLGASIDTIKKLFPKERVYRVYVYDQNNRYLQYQIVASDKITPFLNVTQDCVSDSICVIKQILVKSPYYKTDRGIVVGDTLDDLFLAYGYLESRWEEENLIVRIGDGIDFIMDTSQIPKRWYKKMNLDRLPLPTKIVGIQISIFE